jgi:hypothetical protein
MPPRNRVIGHPALLATRQLPPPPNRPEREVEVRAQAFAISHLQIFPIISAKKTRLNARGIEGFRRKFSASLSVPDPA